MADPARIKVEDASDRAASSNEKMTDVKKEPEDASATASNEDKEPSSQEQPKQEQKSVSVYHKPYIVLVALVPYT